VKRADLVVPGGRVGARTPYPPLQPRSAPTDGSVAGPNDPTRRSWPRSLCRAINHKSKRFPAFIHSRQMTTPIHNLSIIHEIQHGPSLAGSPTSVIVPLRRVRILDY
jgi:hypothetical protein